MRGWLPWAAGVALFGALSVGAQHVVRSFPPREVDVNMLFVPPSTMVKKGAAGFENVIADSLWLTLLQYYGERFFIKETKMMNLDAMFDLITDLDPKFWFAYWLGAWALSDDQQVDEAIAMLQKGERLNPDHLHYPYLEGFIRFLYRQDYVGAAACFERAATRPIAEWEDQKRFARSLAARMYQRQGKDRLALQIWENLAKSPDKATAEIAKKNVKRIQDEISGKREKSFEPGSREPGAMR